MPLTRIQSAALEPNALTSTSIADGNVITSKLADSAVTTTKLNASAVIGVSNTAINVAVTDDTSTNTTHYLYFGTSASGNIATKVSSTKLTFNPNTGEFSSPKANFSGVEAVKIPAGTTAQRPGTPTTGMVRFNTDTGLLEIYNGSQFANVSATGGITGAAYTFFIKN